MQKIKETLTTLLQAARYSFGFCWRNSKPETTGRIIISALITLFAYLTVQATGFIINAVQTSSQKLSGKDMTFMQIMNSGLSIPVVFLLTVVIGEVLLGRFEWFFRSTWNQKLHFANMREINEHRATLDVACFRSKEYDDTIRRIAELPWGWRTRSVFSDEMLNLFTRVVSFLLFGASLLWYKPLYALILVVTALPMAVVEFQLVARWWDLTQGFVPHHKKRHVLEKPYSSPHSFVQALMFNQMPALRQQIDVNVNDVISSYDKIRALIVKREVFTYLFSVLVLCGVIIHAIRSTLTTGGEIGTLTIVMAAAKIFQKNLENIVSLIAEQWNSAKGIILIEKEFFGLKPLISTKHPVTPKFNGIPLIRFERVSFAYPQSNTLALKEVSFTLEPGSKVAIVGKSGNGKSTIQALLTRQYDPTSGSIFVEDIDLKRIEPSRWNQFIAALTQEWAILERPIGEEIASSRLGETIDLEEVAASARFANFVEVVDADPAGYNSQIGTEFGGREFSGGEKQRLALARVHYRGTPILILDEPDAKLDPESAKKVMERIFALKGVTVVIITHHVSRAEQCDKIIVMGKGEIAEQGTHAELMARNGVYASMYRKDQKRLG